MYKFDVIGPIVGKQRPRVNMCTGNVYTPGKTKDYEEFIRQSFFVVYPSHQMLNSRVKMNIIAYFKIPKSANNEKEMLENNVSPTKKPDIDNITKIVLDAINNYVIKDDIQVTKISVEKRYGVEEKLTIEIEEY